MKKIQLFFSISFLLLAQGCSSTVEKPLPDVMGESIDGDNRIIKSVVNKNSPYLKNCLSKVMKRNNDLNIHLDVSFTIDRYGHTEDAKVSDLLGKRLAQCMEKVIIEKYKFPMHVYGKYTPVKFKYTLYRLLR